MQQHLHLAAGRQRPVHRQRRRPVQSHRLQGRGDRVGARHAVTAHVDEVRVIDRADLHDRAALYRGGKHLVLRIHDHGRRHAHAVGLEQRRDPLAGAAQRQTAGERIRVDPVAAGGHQQRAAPHQVLVDGEALPLAHRLRRHDQQRVDLRRHLALAQVDLLHRVVVGELLLQELPGGKRLLRPPERVLGEAGRRQPDADGAQEPGGDPLQRRLDRRGDRRRAVLVLGPHDERLLAGLQDQVEVVGLRREQRHRDRPQSVPVGELLPPGRAVGAGVDLPVHQRAARALGQRASGLGHQRARFVQLRRQRVRGHVQRQLHGIAQRREQRVDAAEPGRRLLDGARQVVLEVAQPHLGTPVAAAIDPDQILEAQHLVLVAVADQHVEVGVDDALLEAVLNLKGRGPDAVALRGLLLGLWIGAGVDYLGGDRAAAGDAVLLQQAADLRRQRRQQGMGALAQVGADHQRLGQILQQGDGRRRQRVGAFRGEVNAQARERAQPHVEQDQVGGGQRGRAERPSSIADGHRAAAPTLGVQRQDAGAKKAGGERQVVNQIAEIQDAALDGGEAAAGADLAQQVAGAAREVGDPRRADQIERAADHRGGNEGDDLVGGARRQEQGERGVGAGHQQRGEVAADHRPRVQVAEQRDRQGQRQGQQQRRGHQHLDRQELAEHQRERPHRQGEQDLQRPGALLLTPLPHAQRRHQQHHQQRHPREQRPHVGDAAGEERLYPEEREQGRRQEGAHGDEGQRRAEVAQHLLARDRQRRRHSSASAASAPRASASNTVSSVRRSWRNSLTGQPPAAAVSNTLRPSSSTAAPAVIR